jgi:hypothetical protein
LPTRSSRSVEARVTARVVKLVAEGLVSKTGAKRATTYRAA